MRTILILCTANQCRSPFAAAALAALLARAGLSDRWQVESAGIWAAPNLPPTNFARLAAAQRGLQIGDHRSQAVDERLLRSASLILVMTRNHREALSAEFPHAAGKVYLVSELINQTFDINDPAGGSEDDYAACYHDLQSILEQGFSRLQELMDGCFHEGLTQ